MTNSSNKKLMLTALIMFVFLTVGYFGGCIVINVENGNNYSSLTFCVESESGFIDVDEAAEKLQSKLDGFGLKNVTVAPAGDDKVVVKFPEEYTKDDIKKFVAVEPNELRFTNANGAKTYLTEYDILRAEVGMNESGKYIVALTFTAAGGEKFAAATGELAEKSESMCIYLGDEIISQPTVSQQITGTSASIEAFDTYDEAERIVLSINAKITGYYRYIAQ